MGITADKKEKGIKTSVASIYLFLKNFFAFFIGKQILINRKILK